MQTESARGRSVNETRNRILDVALDVLGRNPDAGMGDIASSAGVVRRTVYGHFPTRTDLVRTLAQRAVGEIVAVLTEVDAPERAAEAVWVDFVARMWPLMRRYRVLLALRRGEYGEEIHTLLEPVDTILAGLVQRGQDRGDFGRHLPAGVLSQVAYATVFSIADNGLAGGAPGARAATITSLLLLGVPEARATALADGQP
ncbi:TetR/AcrR family transcriptional regulator [Actinacidiphila bryophytorum]|uniref:TetR/AcrR family transcriptional regulator n=1 Tax=Actinacidiphila bryophytorum TaxID=1436133 RepID=A0A9W4H2J0_9ACTN|nr:TetR/AcrR family transcriptional regulator [Actinacidiphila bryophytorum]MBM9440293.1 TetR/AcrR family transcriptional regulator [Actinacidiphila bryophytorum]MBN6545994.1 TetR/AcrR family transcriptional regulator [Actinacidiphila bryophytorum]CAG7645720.1 TetR/AcrR family transcriptional regulator [Actinacidiphila bryophytorum]